jgi:hypothetical protein
MSNVSDRGPRSQGVQAAVPSITLAVCWLVAVLQSDRLHVPEIAIYRALLAWATIKCSQQMSAIREATEETTQPDNGNTSHMRTVQCVSKQESFRMQAKAMTPSQPDLHLAPEQLRATVGGAVLHVRYLTMPRAVLDRLLKVSASLITIAIDFRLVTLYNIRGTWIRAGTNLVAPPYLKKKTMR